MVDRLGLGPSAFGRVSSSLTYPTRLLTIKMYLIMVETLSELLENAANVAEDNGGKLSIASAAILIAEAYELGMDKATKLLTEDANNC